MFPVIADLYLDHRFPTLFNIVEKYAFKLSQKNQVDYEIAYDTLENYVLASAYLHARANPQVWGYRDSELQREWLRRLCSRHYNAYINVRRGLIKDIEPILALARREVISYHAMTGVYSEFYYCASLDVSRIYFEKPSFDELNYDAMTRVIWREISDTNYFKLHLSTCVDYFHSLISHLRAQHRLVHKAKSGAKLNQLEQMGFANLNKKLTEVSLNFIAEIIGSYFEEELQKNLQDQPSELVEVERVVATTVYSIVDSLIMAAAVSFLNVKEREVFRAHLSDSIHDIVPEVEDVCANGDAQLQCYDGYYTEDVMSGTTNITQ